MNAALYRFGVELRAGGWRFVLGAAVLLALGGGSALLAATGARRTASAFERLESATSATQVLVNPDDQEVLGALSDGRLDTVDGVQAVSVAQGIVALLDGTVVPAAVLQPAPDGGPGWFTEIDRPVVREGRLPDQRRPDEMFANPAGAVSARLRVGDTVDLALISADELSDDAFAGDGDESPEERIEQLVADGLLGRHTTVRLVGIGVTAADVVPGGELDAIYLTQAFADQQRAVPVFVGIGVRLTDGTDGVDAFIRAVRSMVPPGSTIDFQTLASDRATVQRAITPQVVALVVIAAVLAAGTVLAVGQTLGRRVVEDGDDDVILAGLGMTPAERRLVDWFRLASVMGLGAVGAVVVAAVSSPITPMGGLARGIEPSPGFSLDRIALAAGGLVLAVVGAAVGGMISAHARRGSTRAATPSALAQWVRARVGAGPLSFGVCLALEPGRGRSSVPTRSTLATAAVGVAALLASLTFAASLDRLVSSPREFGSNFSALVQPGDLEGREREAFSTLATVLDDTPGVEAWSQLHTEQVGLPHGVVPVNAIGFEKSDTASPTLVKGRFPDRADEIALGAVTMRREGVSIGDRLEIDRRGRDESAIFDVVGQVVLPGIADYRASDQAALGVGAMLSLEGLATVTGAASYGDPTRSETVPTAVLVTLADGTTPADLDRVLVDAVGPGGFVVEGPIRSSDIASLERVRATPTLLASLLGTVAAVAVGHALVVAVRRRRRDLAVLRAVGFTPRQVSRTVAWQATTVGVLSTIVGIPLGVVAARVAWGAVCKQLGVVSHPATPVVAIAVALPAAVAFANLVALVPGRRAARVRAADILRAAG